MYEGDRLEAVWLIFFAIIALFSTLIYQMTKHCQRALQGRDGFLFASLFWILFSLEAAWPMHFSHISTSFTNAYFEAVSGLTTTGSSIYPNPDLLEPSINFWRHLLNWLGGMGIIVLAVAIIPTLGIGGMNIIKAEMSGVNKGQKLTPRIRQTAAYLWGTYIVITLIVALALWGAGMSLFDAICHAFSSISLGGFSTHGDSIGYFHSFTIELILEISMLMGCVNFVNHVQVIRYLNPRLYLHDVEIRSSFKILFLSILISSIYLWYKGYYGTDAMGLLTSFRNVLFNYVSVATTCGYSTVDFAKWPIYAGFAIYILANFIPNSGSTGGGVKMIRAVIQFKVLGREIVTLLHPKAVKPVKVNGSVLPTTTALTVMSFILVYFVVLITVTLLMIFTGQDPVSAYSFTVATLTNSGPGIGQLGPMADLNVGLTTFQKWLELITMLLGRLEIFTLLVLFLPDYWKN